MKLNRQPVLAISHIIAPFYNATHSDFSRRASKTTWKTRQTVGAIRGDRNSPPKPRPAPRCPLRGKIQTKNRLCRNHGPPFPQTNNQETMTRSNIHKLFHQSGTFPSSVLYTGWHHQLCPNEKKKRKKKKHTHNTHTQTTHRAAETHNDPAPTPAYIYTMTENQEQIVKF